MRSSHSLLLASIALAAACGGDGAAPATGGTGGRSPGSGGSGSGTGGGAPSCRGTPIPPGGVSPGADGRSIDVSCAGVALHVSVVESGILRLRYRGSATPSGRASYAVVDQPPAEVHPIFGGTADSVLVCTDDLLVEIARADCHVTATAADGTVVLQDPAGGGYFEAGGPGGLARGVSWSAAPGEHFYGFGEKTGPLDKRGTAMTFWNTDAYQASFGGYAPDADPLYQSIPFFVGLRGAAAYGVFLDDTHRLRFDMASQDPARYTLATAGDEIDQYLFAGPAMSDVLRRYTWLTGRMPLPPRWTLGYHQSRWGYSPDTMVLAVAQEFRSRKLPADGIWLDIQHLDGFRSWTWDPVAFPDPAGLVQGLGSIGFKAVSIVDPGVKVDPGWDVYDAGLAQGHFLAENGAPYVGQVWPGDAVFPDFSSPAARSWWGSLVPRELGEGVQGLWIDMNEPSNFVMSAGGTVPDDAVCAGDGVPGTMADLHNVYALDEARATFEGMAAAEPSRRPFLLSRAGYAGVQRYAAVWTGDAPSTWATLQGTLPMLLGMGLSGLAFAGSDVGGYSGGATPELFARWMQVGSFSPFFRGHVTTGVNPQEPWQFGTEVEDISRGVLGDRYELLPYLYSLFHEASQTGAPVVRPLVYAFQSDPAVANLGDEAMLGPSLLYAPVLEPGAMTKSVYLPAGRWFELHSGAIHEGPVSFQTAVTLGALPVYAREGAIVPRMQPVQWSDQAPITALYLDLYPSAEPSTFALYEDDGASLAYQGGARSLVTYTLQQSPAGASLAVSARDGAHLPAPRPLIARVRRVDHGVSAVRLSGKALPALPSYDALLGAGQGYWYDDRDLSAVVVIPDQVSFDLALDYDPSIADPAPPVSMTFQVTVPAGTPATTPIHIATSASQWTHQPLAWDPGMASASGLVPVPRGDWVFYKYTRGDWSTVEKWPGCVEATNRYVFGSAHPVKQDTVWAWADQCP